MVLLFRKSLMISGLLLFSVTEHPCLWETFCSGELVSGHCGWARVEVLRGAPHFSPIPSAFHFSLEQCFSTFFSLLSSKGIFLGTFPPNHHLCPMKYHRYGHKLWPYLTFFASSFPTPHWERYHIPPAENTRPEEGPCPSIPSMLEVNALTAFCLERSYPKNLLAPFCNASDFKTFLPLNSLTY